MEARAAWVVGPSEVELRSEELPPVAPGQVAVRTLYTGVSRGTERLVLEGRVPPEVANQMAAPHQVGVFPWPVKYGYANVGVVEAGALPPGAVVFCLYPHQDRYVVDAGALAFVPAGVPPGRAVLTPNVETALNAVWDGGVGPGDRVVVVGGGVVGCLIAWLCGRIPGAEVVLVDIDARRAPIAAQLRVGFADPAEAPADADVVFHASATEGGLRTALGCAGREARVVEASWFGTTEVTLGLGGAFFHRRVQLVASQVGTVSPSRAARFDYRRRLGVALSLLGDPALDVLIDGETPFDLLPSALPAVARGVGGGLCHRVRYP